MQDNIFKARCSKIGDIMTEPKSAADKAAGNLGETVKTYVCDWFNSYRWGRVKKVRGKAITKGNITEDECIENIAIVHELGYGVEKHVGRVETEWLQGECDLLIKDRSLVIDAKSSFKLSSFPMYRSKNPFPKYEAQGQGYMELYDVENFWLCYCLVDSPVYMVEEALRYELFELQKQNKSKHKLTPEEEMFIIQDMTFTYAGYIEVCQALNIKRDPNFIEIPLERRVKTFKFERDRIFMSKVKSQVEKINNFINTEEIFAADLLYLRNIKQLENVSTN